MPVFHWSARNKDGQEMSGVLNARTKEQVIDSLRRMGVTVTSLTEARSKSSEPSDPDRGSRAIERSNPFRTIVIFLLIAAAVIGALVYFGKIHIP